MKNIIATMFMLAIMLVGFNASAGYYRFFPGMLCQRDHLASTLDPSNVTFAAGRHLDISSNNNIEATCPLPSDPYWHAPDITNIYLMVLNNGPTCYLQVLPQSLQWGSTIPISGNNELPTVYGSTSQMIELDRSSHYSNFPWDNTWWLRVLGPNCNNLDIVAYAVNGVYPY